MPAALRVACLPFRRQPSAAQRISVLPSLPALMGRVPQSNTVIHKVLGHRVEVSTFCPQVLTAPAACLPLPWRPSAGHGSPVHCAAAPVAASSASFTVGPSFKAEQETQGCREHARCNQTEKVQPALGLSPNNTLQRSGSHKVLGRGRGLANLIAVAPRPRADKSARGR